jgi:two-component system response regulator HydG
VKLLRALQERVISRVGDNKTSKVDVRLIAASNEDLIKLVKTNEFREDLYHRLNGFRIHVPPLRERTEDIIPFVEFFITRANKAFQRNVTGFSDAVGELILRYPWYGNIRELQNVINRAVLLTAGSTIEAESLPDEIRFPDLQTNLKQAMADQNKDGI